MRLKMFFKYVVEFIMGVTFFLFIVLLLLKVTVLKEPYVIGKLEENQYYDFLADKVKEDMSYYIVQSGLDEEVLSGIFTKEMIREHVESVFHAFYQNEEVSIDVSNLKKSLEDNIDSYFAKNNIQISDQEALDLFVLKIAEVYQENVSFSNGLDFLSSYVYRVNHVLDYVLVVLCLVVVLSHLYLIIVSKEKPLAISFFTVSILSFLIAFLINQYIDLENIVFYNDKVSDLIEIICFDFLHKLQYCGGIALILAIFSCIFYARSSMKKEKRK